MFYQMGTAEYKSRAANGNTYENKKFGHTLEVISSANSGNLIMDHAEFSLAAYEAKCYQNDLNSPEYYRDLHIAFEGDIDEDGQSPLGTVQAKDLPRKEIYSYDNIENAKALEEGVKYLVDNNFTYKCDLGVDAVQSLIASLQGNEEAKENILTLTKYSEDVKDTITDILTSSAIDDKKDLTLVERIILEVRKYA